MDEMQNQEAPKMSSVEQEEFEMSHTDKLVGVFSEPGNTFSKMSKFPPKTTDWIIPILIIIVVALLSNIVMMSNPTIRMSITEKNMRNIEKRFDEMVAKGQMSQTQANEQLETIRERMDQGVTAASIALQAVSIVIVTFLIFFVVSGVFFLFAKFALKGEATYKDAMVAYGLPHYIIVIQVIVMVICAFIMNKFFTSTSVGAFLESDTSTLSGFLLNKLDLFSSWFYAVTAIGFAKMFKSNNTGKYIATIFSLWIGFSLILFFLGKAVPFLGFFTGM